MTDLTVQIAQAIARTRAEFTLWDVSNVIVHPTTWDALVAEMGHIAYKPLNPPLPTKGMEILGVPVVPNAHHGPGFTVERAQTFRFRA